MRCDPRDVVRAIKLSRATYRKMVQNLLWATTYNLIAIPAAAGIFIRYGLDLPMSVGALAMNLSSDAHNGQRDAVHFLAILRNAGAARLYAPADGASSPGRQQLHRTVPSQLEGRRSQDLGVSQLARSTNLDRALDRAVQPRPASSRCQKSNSPGAFLAFGAVLNSETLTVSIRGEHYT